MELTFKVDTRLRKQFFVPESFAHPAKMNFYLLLWIVEKYTTAGETILDPMAGMGTSMLACTLGRNVVLVELEERFCKMCQDNWEIVRTKPQLGFQVGNCQILQGDARQLEGLLVDKIISSPPHGNRLSDVEVKDGDPQRMSYRQALGKVDKIVTSPPYVTGARGNSRSPFWDRLAEDPSSERYGRQKHPSLGEGYSPSKDNIGNLPYGQIEKIITSPPYAAAQSGGGIAQEGYTKDYQKGKIGGQNIDPVGKRSYMPENAGDNPDNIQRLPYGQIEKIITSPPYEGSFTHSEQDPEKRFERLKEVDREGVKKGAKWAITSDEALRRRLAQQDGGYGSREDNIGNLKSQSYLEAMLQVYRSCFAVLKPEGLLILVVKNFIRNRQVVRLDTDTIKLCEQAGFAFVERHYRKLTSQSFWRIIYAQRYPSAPTIDFEDILVFSKPSVI